MAQSDIQSYLQQLSGVHTQGQANVPSAVNNGNPNTIYNVKPQQGGYLPPVTNALDHWRINPGGGINWQELAGQGGFGFNLAGIAPKPSTPPSGWTPPVGGGGGGTPPPVVGGGGGGGSGPPGQGNGGDGPGNQNPGGNGLPTGGYGGGGTNPRGGADWYDFGGDRTQLGGLITDRPTASNTEQTSSAWDQAGWGGATADQINDFLSNDINLGPAGQSLFGTPLGRAFGINQDGDIALGQIIDFFIPGNVYMGQTGKWNLMNALPTLLAKISPPLAMALRSWMDNKGKQYENTDDEDLNWWQKLLKHRYQKNKENKQQGRNGGGGTDGRDAHQGGGPLGGDLGIGMGTGLDPLGGLFGGSVTIGGTGPGQISGTPGGSGPANPFADPDVNQK